MAITYPLSLPAAPRWRRSAFRYSAVVAVSRSPFTLKEQVQEHQGEIWMADIELPPMPRATAAEWTAFQVSLKGRKGTFLVGDYDARTPLGIATGTPLVDSGGSPAGNEIRARELITDGWTIDTTGILKAGDYLQIGTGASAQLYMNLTDADSDGGGAVTLNIAPGLRSAPANDAPIIVSNTVGVFRLADNTVAWDADAAAIYGISFSAVEAL